MNREAIHQALFALLQTVPGFVTSSRRLKHWGEVDKNKQPALFLAAEGEEVTQGQEQPRRYTLRFSVYLYAKGDDKDIPSARLNPLLDGVLQALSGPPITHNVQTLGGMVTRCWVEGTIQTDEGVLGDQAVAIVPIRIQTGD